MLSEYSVNVHGAPRVNATRESPSWKTTLRFNGNTSKGPMPRIFNSWLTCPVNVLSFANTVPPARQLHPPSASASDPPPPGGPPVDG